MMMMTNKNEFLFDCDTIYQISTSIAISNGCLDGFLTLKEIKRLGNFGIGSITGLEGEIIYLNDEFHHFSDNGLTNRTNEDFMSPRMLITNFKSKNMIEINQNTTYQKIKKIIESSMPTQNIMYAIKIIGVFNWVKIKCFPKQIKPYPQGPIELTCHENALELQNISGVLVGYFMTDLFKKVNSSKYHFHFMSADKKHGGHLVDCQITNCNIEIDSKHNLMLFLPNTSTYYNVDLIG